MNCERYLDLISARLDGALSPQEQAELDAHLQTCPACRAIAKDLEGLHSALTEIDEVEAPAELSSSVLTKIKAEKQSKRRRLIRTLSTLAACLVLCVGVLRITDSTYSELNRTANGTAGFSYASQPETALADQTASEVQPLPDSTQSVTEESKFKSLPFSIDAYSLAQTSAPVTPSAQLLDSAAGLERFLAQFPKDDLSAPKSTYDANFFLQNRLLAIVVQEPSSSITHTISQLTEDHVTLLRDIPETGDSDMALWLLLVPTELSGPERTMTIDFANP